MATKWKGKLDPTDETDFVAMFDKVLDVGEFIDTFDLEPDANGVTYGLTISEAVGYEAAKVAVGERANTAVKMWLSIAEDKRGDPKFTAGIDLGVIVTITTTAMPTRRFQRTWHVNVVQQ